MQVLAIFPYFFISWRQQLLDRGSKNRKEAFSCAQLSIFFWHIFMTHVEKVGLLVYTTAVWTGRELCVSKKKRDALHFFTRLIAHWRGTAAAVAAAKKRFYKVWNWVKKW